MSEKRSEKRERSEKRGTGSLIDAGYSCSSVVAVIARYFSVGTRSKESEPVPLSVPLNGDFAVDDLDLEILEDNIGMSNPTLADGDFDGDGYIYAPDLELFFALYGLELEAVS